MCVKEEIRKQRERTIGIMTSRSIDVYSFGWLVS